MYNIIINNMFKLAFVCFLYLAYNAVIFSLEQTQKHYINELEKFKDKKLTEIIKFDNTKSVFLKK